MASSNGKKRITTTDVYQEVMSLKVAVCGHPDIPDDKGLFGDVKYIRREMEATTVRVVQSEVAIAQIVARCEERHGLRSVVAEIPKSIASISKKKLAGAGGGLIAVATIIYYLGQLVGWW